MRLLPLAGLLLGCPPLTDPATLVDPVASLREPGPYGVGYHEGSLTWDAGAACPGTEAGPRTLRVALWYPTQAQEGPELRYLGLFPAPGVIRDAPRAPGAFPLLVYSHGSQGYAEASGRLMRHLASHGQVVAAVDHTGNTFLDGDRTTAIYWQRPGDLGALIEHVRADHPVAGPLTEDPVLAYGHSFGGYTLHALAGATFRDPALFAGCADGTDTSPFCSTMTPAQQDCFQAGFRDDRIAAVFSMAPGDHRLFSDAGLGDTQVPVLLMTGGFDDRAQGELNWGALDRPGNLRVHIEDAGHNAFADVAAGLDTQPGVIDDEEGWAVIGAYQLAWARYQRGDRSVAPVLDGTLAVGQTATVHIGQ